MDLDRLCGRWQAQPDTGAPVQLLLTWRPWSRNLIAYCARRNREAWHAFAWLDARSYITVWEGRDYDREAAALRLVLDGQAEHLGDGAGELD